MRETKIIDFRGGINREDMLFAAECIRRGGLVVFPTETVYGLGADATNAEAAKKIYAAKGRPSDNPLIIHIASPADAEKYARTNELYYELARRFMPGALTVVLPALPTVPKETTGGLDTVAVRCPENPIANELIRLAGVPIAAPSANLSGSPSPTSPQHVIDDMLGRVDVIINGGDAEIGLESTIVKIEEDGSLTLLRPGKITPDELLSVAPEIRISSAVTERLSENEKVQSPGMKYRHYAPKSPLSLISGDSSSVIGYIKDQAHERLAVISYTEDEQRFKESFPGADIHVIGDRCDGVGQAKRLFFILRLCDKSEYDMIYAPVPSSDGIGLALYNRMIRAAAYKIIKL